MKALRSRDGDSISLILYMGLGRTDDEAEKALFDVNQGLEEYGPVLPAGVVINLPELSLSEPEKVVNVWD